MQLKIVLSLLILFATVSNAQNKKAQTATFGEITSYENSLAECAFDPDAPAVVLFEKRTNAFEVITNYLYLVKEVHRKIKVFNASEFDGASVSIPFYTPASKRHEHVEDLKIMTHNGMLKRTVQSDQIYEVQVDDKWSEKRFTFPDVQDGSILEYTYRIETPYFFNFGDWQFQGSLPKLYSEISASIPGNYVYQKSIIGRQELDINEVDIKKGCLEIPGAVKDADCEQTTYAMFNVPSFEEEPYMLSHKNYTSRLSFELKEATSFTGEYDSYTKSWEDVDKEFKKEKDMGRQLNYESFFKKNMPAHIFEIRDTMERAAAVFAYIRDHYTWNGEYRIFSEIRVKEAFSTKAGNIAEINLSLINALNAADIPALISLSATRKLPIPGKIYPVLTDFNYVMAYIKLDGEDLLLDASNRLLSFGMVPFKVLNDRARIMDFKEGSYWLPIVPASRNLQYTQVKAKVTSLNQIEGNIEKIYGGYEGLKKRSELATRDEKVFDSDVTEVLDASFFNKKIVNRNDVEAPLRFKQDFTVSKEVIGNNLYIRPTLFNDLEEQDIFKQDKRQFPVELGYLRKQNYIYNLDLGDFYTVETLPEPDIFRLPENGGECAILYSIQGNTVQCVVRYSLKRISFTAAEYGMLKDFYTKLFQINDKALLKLIPKVGQK